MTRRRLHPREQHPTAFSDALDWLCAVTGARGAALVDAEGETVDYGGDINSFDIRVVAAELRLLAQRLAEARELADAHELVVRARRKSFLLETLPEGYALVIELPRRASGVSERALALGIQRLCAEAGFSAPKRHGSGWRAIQVSETAGRSHRPEGVMVDGVKQSLIVLGRLNSPASTREVGFRVRLGTGQEGNLIREALGRWYLEEET